jgi:hypothetical protein
VRLAWPEGDDAAEAAARRLAGDATTAYARFKALLGTDVPTDANVPCHHGADGAFDVYFVGSLPGGVTGENNPYGGSCSDRSVPSWANLAAWRRSSLAHEIFHAFQRAVGAVSCEPDTDWLTEGTATWATRLAFRQDTDRHAWKDFLRNTDTPLTSFAYDAWPLFLFLQERYGLFTIRQMLLDVFDMTPELALDAAVEGGFEEMWRELTRYGWNQDPIQKSFRDWDRFTVTPQVIPDGRPVVVSLPGPGARIFSPTHEAGGTTRSYHHFKFVGPQIVSVVFENRYAGLRDAGVQAFVRLRSGRWLTEDWSDRERVEYCGVREDEDIAELVIMYSNESLDTGYRFRSPRPPLLTVSSLCSYYFRVTGGSASQAFSGKYGANCPPPNRQRPSTTVTPAGPATWRFQRSPLDRADMEVHLTRSKAIGELHSPGRVIMPALSIQGCSGRPSRLRGYTRQFLGPVAFIDGTPDRITFRFLSLLGVLATRPGGGLNCDTPDRNSPLEQVISLEKFRSEAPITIAKTAQEDLRSNAPPHGPNRCRTSHNYSVKLERVAENGRPLGE